MNALSRPAPRLASAVGLALALLALPALAGAEPEKDVGKGRPAEKKAKPRFTVGKETTHVLGPLDEDGRIDYAAAVNERLGKGVKPETNAVVLLWRAMGPRPTGGEVPP